MTDLRKAAQQALHELAGIPFYRKYGVRISNAITALQAALEQQAEPVLLECVTCGTVYADGVPPQVPVQEHITHITWDERGVRTVNGIPDDAPQQQAEPSQWRDMVVVSLVREGINKHRARELADHFATPPQRQLDKTSFNDWWDSEYDDSENRFEKDSAAYWAWAGWQAAQRPWVGLTDEDVNRESAPITSQMKLAFHAGMYVAQKILKERNT